MVGGRNMIKGKKIELFDVINYSLILLVVFIMLYPFINVLAVSLSDYTEFIKNPLMIVPKNINFEAYKEVLDHPMIYRSYINTIIVTGLGILLSQVVYILTAYPLSKKSLKGRSIVLKLVIFSMIFNAGLIPNYWLMQKLHLIDKLPALILPSLFSGFNIILMKNFFESIPESLEEAAKIDGAEDPYILMNIILPLSKPIIATLCLFTAVGFWNSFMNAVIYMRSPKNWTLQLLLREIILGANMNDIAGGVNDAEKNGNVATESLKYASLIVTTLPILCVYPFVQKYFISGIMLGSVKG
jgi:putative aldouronate transport system permease protein